MEYKKYIYSLLIGDCNSDLYTIHYLKGWDIVELGKNNIKNFPYSYETPNFSRWDYMKKLIDFYEETESLSCFFDMYIYKHILPYNSKEEVRLFLSDINSHLEEYNQKLEIENSKIILRSFDYDKSLRAKL